MTFDRRNDGTLEARWRRDAHWPDVRPVDLTGVAHLIVVAAHPDDESLGAGGLIARCAGAGLPIEVIVATDGEKSHPGSLVLREPELARIRRSELRESVAAVAPTASIDFLGLPDAGLRAHRDALAEAIRARILGPHTLVIAPWRADGHGDHEAAGLAAQQAVEGTEARLLEYPIWLWHWAAPEDDRVPWSSFATFDLSAGERLSKAQAIEAHETQQTALSLRPEDQPVLDEAFLEHFARGFEVFIESEPHSDAHVPADSRTATPSASLGQDFFDRFYADADDPWGFETRWYEKRKRSITIASLPRERFGRALEVGCSIGVLTEQLADRCDAVLAVDVAERPLAIARQRLAARSSVRFERMLLPGEWPEGTFDLIVVSEVGYYWSAADRSRAIGLAERSLAADGVLVLCHWRHAVKDYPEAGDAVHQAFVSESSLVRLVFHEEEDFLLDILVREGSPSVARETGLL